MGGYLILCRSGACVVTLLLSEERGEGGRKEGRRYSGRRG